MSWYMIVIDIAVIAVSILFIVRFIKQSREVQYEQVRGWLLQAVILAEHEYGSGTGRMKLSAVYDEFCSTLPWIAKILSFDTFSKYVDEALDEAKHILSGNSAMARLAKTMITSTSTSEKE